MSRSRREAALAGGLYLLTVVTSVAALALKHPLVADPTLLARDGGPARLMTAVVLELLLAVSCVGTAVALYPTVHRARPLSALGLVCSRTVEAGIIVVGVLCMASLATLVSTGVSTQDSRVLVALHDWAFLIGPGVMPVVNALLLAPALLRAGLVPRVIPILGVVGAPLLLASDLGTLFGVLGQVSTVAGLAALPIAAWEISLGAWLLAKGFLPIRTEAAHHDLIVR